MLSILRRSWLFALLGLAALASSARAQYTEFEAPTDFDTDYQFFEPAEADDYGGFPPPNTGWYGKYDRMFMNTTRPRFEPSHTQGDFGWGNRLDVGFMTEQNTGWSFSGMRMGDGLNVTKDTFVPRLSFNPTATSSIPFTPNSATSFDQGNPNFDPRVNQDLLVNSLNSVRFSTFEVNRVWRLDMTHRGGIIEPFIGFRYADVNDRTRRMNQFQIAAAGFEQLTDQTSYWQNSMFGGQIGVRLARQLGRWNVASELRLAGYANFQHFNQDNYQTTRLYTTAPITAPTAIAQEFVTFNNVYGSNEEFVIGGDVRVNASYEITRDIAANVGAQWIGLGKGIARGPVLNNNTGDIYMAGVSFGVSINR